MTVIWIKNLIQVFFSISVFINAALFIPQAIKLFKTKNAQGLSLATFLGFNAFQFFTALHGFMIGDDILMIGFLLSFITCGMVTTMIFLYSKKDNGGK